MARNSSTSSSESPTRARWARWCLLVAIATWGLYAATGKPLAGWIAAQWGDALIARGNGRIQSPAAFLLDRFYELALLISVAAVLVLVGHVAWRLLERRVPKIWLWAPLSLFIFAEVNVWTAVAAHTGIAWCVLFAGYPNLTQSSFHAERILATQSRNPQKAFILGSSQGHSEIHSGELNRLFENEVAFGNLSVSGLKGYDFLMLEDFYDSAPPDVVICYLSELNFYEIFSGRLCLPFLTWHGLQETYALGEGRDSVDDGIPHGVVGSALPLYRMRRAFEAFLFGGIAEFSPNVMIPIWRDPVKKSAAMRRAMRRAAHRAAAANAHDANVSAAVPSSQAGQFYLERERLIKEVDDDYHLGLDSRFNQRAFERFLERNQALGVKCVVIVGQLNPDYAQYVDPAIRADFDNYIQELRRKYPAILVLTDELPTHTVEDYTDYWHIKKSKRLEFTRRLAEVLAEKLDWPPPRKLSSGDSP